MLGYIPANIQKIAWREFKSGGSSPEHAGLQRQRPGNRSSSLAAAQWGRDDSIAPWWPAVTWFEFSMSSASFKCRYHSYSCSVKCEKPKPGCWLVFGVLFTSEQLLEPPGNDEPLQNRKSGRASLGLLTKSSFEPHISNNWEQQHQTDRYVWNTRTREQQGVIYYSS